MIRNLSLLVLMVSFTAACGEDVSPPIVDAGEDAKLDTTPAPDTGPDAKADVQPDVQLDAQPQPDIGPSDADTPDIGDADTGQPDVGEPDTGQPDVDASDPKPDAGEPDAGDPDIGQPGFEYHNFELIILEIVNQSRATPTDCGQYGTLPAAQPLALDEELTKAARAHSQDMADGGFLSHTGSDGSSFVDRVNRTDYEGFPRGENIAYGYSSPESVMNGWLGSDGHCRNIMMSDATDIGIGYVEGGTNRHTYTQVFGRK